ncbi:MAG TPA: penicillin-binding protein 2 [Candidatus Binatia bacterium]|nr:penicillin-binding protein 2 [Candidatus Binatia bacterium]
MNRSFYVATREVPPELQRRMGAAALVVFAMFALVAARLWYLQVERGAEMRDRSENNRLRLVRLPAARGVVYDRNGEILIDNRPSFDAVFVPEDARDRRLVLKNLARYLGEEESVLHQRVRGPRKRPPYEGIVLRRDVDWQGVVALETHQLDLPAVSLQVAPKRYYPFGTLAAHLLGYVGEVSESELVGGASDYRPGDLRGKAGLESAWDVELQGHAGGEEVEADALGRRVRVIDKRPDVPGNNLTLTLDRDLQETAERALGDSDGAVVALDPRNGELLVMVSHPAYDPNVFARGIRRDEWRALLQDKKHPLNNRAVQGQYPPGSTFKIAVATGALDLGIISPGFSVSCGGGLQFGGHYFHCWRKGGHGAVALHAAIVESCDVFFYQVGQRMGVDAIADYAHRLGLGIPSGIALDHEKAGTIPDTQWKRERFHQQWFAGETLSVAIGQGYVTATPLQLAQMAAMIANGGIRYRPHYVKRVEAPDGTLRREVEPEVLGDAHLKPSTLAAIRSAMRDVVMADRGTGKKARVPGIEVAGKTGTAQAVGEANVAQRDARTRRDHAWFVAFAPVDEPEIAIAALVEHAGEHGGTVAAPIAQAVLARYFTRGQAPVPPETPAGPASEPPAREAHADRPTSDHAL